jgi:subtilisin-like proprotein convertase family protein
MNPFLTLRSWLGRPSRPHKKTPADRHDFKLRCEHLEDRINPDKALASLPINPPPVTGSELIAQVRSTTPFQDLVNVVTFLGLGDSVRLTQSSIVFMGADIALLSVALTSPSVAPTVTQALMSAGIFDFVSPNFVYATAAGTGPDLRERIPNDPIFPDQYHHAIIQTPAAWNRTFGSPSVIVAVLDDGVDINHPDLKDSIWSNPREIAGTGRDDDGNGFIDDIHGWDFVNNRPTVTPDSPADTHGTQVAGLIAGRIDNGLGIAGVAGRTSIMPLKVIGNGPTTSLTLARAVGYAVQNGARIINNSLNIDPFVNDPVFKAAVTFAYNSGLLWVNSAGNLNLANPARQAFDEILFVAATDRNDVKTPYSNYGTGIDLAAPGGLPDDGLFTTIVGGGYGPAFGTSMAAALVSGTAALIWSAFPDYTRDQVASTLLGTADNIDLKNPAYQDLLGAGRLNAGRALSGAPFVTPLGRLKGLPATGQPAPAMLSGFTLRLVSPLNPATVVPANFELRWAGPDNTFNTPDDVLIPLTSQAVSNYKIFTNQLDFAVGAELPRGLYRFTARSAGLTDPFGRPVDGNRNGQPGGDLVHVFGIEFQVAGRIFEDVTNNGSMSDTDPPSAGQPVFADVNGNGKLDRVAFTSSHSALPIPDADPNGVTAPIVVTGVSSPAYDITVTVFVSHPRLSDLTITLVGPNGVEVVLFRNRQLVKLTPNSTQLIFQDDIEESASDEIPTLAVYKLRPEERLDQLRDLLANGTWKVVVTDTTPGDTGGLIHATINFATEPVVRSDANGNFSLVGLPPGTTTLFVNPLPGWAPSAGGGKIVLNPITDEDIPQTVSFGLLRQGAVYGRVLLDNGDGVIGPGDTGLAGVKVFIDRNGNGIPDGNDPVAITDANGNYVLTGLSPGKHVIRLAAAPGIEPISPAVRTAAFGTLNPVSVGNDFLVRRDTGPIQVALSPVGPSIRTTPVDAVPIILSEPVPDFHLSDLTLFRDGNIVPLTGATLIGAGTKYTLFGLGGLTAEDGDYRLRATVPAPRDEPSRQPAPVEVGWTMDATPPTGVLSAVHMSGVTAVQIDFSEPVFGVTPAAFVLRRDGQVVPLTGAEVIGSGANYQLINLAPLTRQIGSYVLELVPNQVTDAAGNTVAGTPSVSFQVDRPLPPPSPPRAGQRTVVGPGAGGAPLVNVYDTVSGKQLFSVIAFELNFTGGVRVAAGDVNGDGIDDIIVVAGPGGGPRVRVFDGLDGRELAGFMAFEPTFTGGLFVTAGDLTGTGVADIVVTPDRGGGPRVRVFEGRTLAPIADFFGIDDPAFRGGARAAIGDVNGDGVPDLVVAAGFGGGPRVAIFDGRELLQGRQVRLVGDFFVFEESLRNGVFVAVGDVNGDGFADVIVGGGPGGGPRVFALSGKKLIETGLLVPLADFFAGDPSSRGGVRVAVKDLDGDPFADILAADGDGQFATIRMYNGVSLLGNPEPPFSEFDAFNPFTGGVFVG